MNILNWITFLLGLPALLIGADFLVKGSSSLAARFGLPSFIIGLTIVAFGTSAPELLIALQASLKDQSSLLLGNVIGSNIANILLIIGIAPFFRPFITKNMIKNKDIIFFVTSVIIASFFLLYDYGKISAIMSIFIFSYIMYSSWEADKNQLEDPVVNNPKPIFLPLLYVLLGMIGLAIGSDWLVDGGQKVAHLFHISPTVIGLIFLAIGTSLPEIATSVYAVRKKEFSLSLGNIIGSNIFNILLILPIAGLIKNISHNPTVQYRDLPFMIGSTLFLSFVIYKGFRITKIGALFSLTLYIIWLFLVAITAKESLI